MGSGSHLMALVAARQRGAPDPEFEVVGDLQGARKALKNKEADLFMWEKFTTKPLVDSGEWSRVAEVPTPWPCFAVCVRRKLRDNARTTCRRFWGASTKKLRGYPRKTSTPSPRIID